MIEAKNAKEERGEEMKGREERAVRREHRVFTEQQKPAEEGGRQPGLTGWRTGL